jgi:hypothetical protein
LTCISGLAAMAMAGHKLILADVELQAVAVGAAET